MPRVFSFFKSARFFVLRPRNERDLGGGGPRVQSVEEFHARFTA